MGKKELEFIEVTSSGTKSWSYLPPTTLYLDVTTDNVDLSDGDSYKLGLAMPFELDKFGPTYQKGIFRGGLNLSGFFVDLGGVSYQWGGGVSVGWFNLCSGIEPAFILGAGFITFIETVLTAKEGTIGYSYLSNLIQRAIPIGTAREILQLFGAHTEESACKNITDQLGLMTCLGYSASYSKQKNPAVAYDMLSEGLDYKYLDPYTRALLLIERDNKLFERNREGIYFGASNKITENIERAMSIVDGFLQKHSLWMKDGSGERPDDEEISIFIGNLLYLYHKLNISADIKKGVAKIKATSPFVLKEAGSYLRFLETVAVAREALNASPYFWKATAATINSLSTSLSDDIAEVPPESVVSTWFKFNQNYRWIRDLMLAPVDKQFELRRSYILWKVRKDYAGSDKQELLAKIDQITFQSEEAAKASYDHLFLKSVGLERVKKINQLYDYFGALTVIRRLSLQDDPLSTARGADLSNIGTTPPASDAFLEAWAFLKTTRSGIALGLQAQMEILLKRIVRDHREELEEEVRVYDEEGPLGKAPFCFSEGGCYEAGELIIEISELLEEIDGGEELIALAESVIQKRPGSLEGLYLAEEEESREFSRLSRRLDEKTEKKAKEYFDALLSYRARVEMVRAYLGE